MQKRKGVPAFIRNTYEMLQREDLKPIVCWAENQNGFLIKNLEEFELTILPQYFKHKKYTSFVRQLNMYGFHKKRNQNNNQNHFQHDQFNRHDLEGQTFQIRRKPEKKKKNQDTLEQCVDKIQEEALHMQVEASSNSFNEFLVQKRSISEHSIQIEASNEESLKQQEPINTNEMIKLLLKQNLILRSCHQPIRESLISLQNQASYEVFKQTFNLSEFGGWTAKNEKNASVIETLCEILKQETVGLQKQSNQNQVEERRHNSSEVIDG